MNQIPRRRVIAAALCLALVTAGLVYVYMRNLERQAQVAVLAAAAKQEIASGTIVSADMVEMREFSASMLPPAAAVNVESVVGMIALEPIEVDAPISRRQVGPAHRLAYRVPPLMRAVTVALDPIIGVGGFIKPGDHVDVVATFNVNNGTVAKTVLQDVELLATGSQLVAKEVEPETGREAKPQTIPNATLAVTPYDAEKLILAENRGKLRLTLRGADDRSFVSSKGTTSRAVMGLVPPDVPEKPRASAAARPQAAQGPAPALPWQIGPISAAGTALGSESGKRIQVVRGTELEETVVAE